jgi:hypothetical protein
MKSHLWNLWGRKFIIDSTMSPTGRGLLIENREYMVHIQTEDGWMPVNDDISVGVLLSFLRRRDPRAKETMAEEMIPESIRESITSVMKQFAGRDAEANAYALCVVCAQWKGMLESRSLKEAM